MFQKEKTITVTARDYKDKDAIYSAEFQGKDGNACLVEVLPDHDRSTNPRTDWENLWTWVTTERAGYSDRVPRSKECYNIYRYDPKTMRNDYLIMPLHLYRHNGDVISVGNYSTVVNGNRPWDGAVMGFAFVSFDKLKKEYSCKRITRQVRERAIACLKAEVEAVNCCNDGRVYGIKVVDMVTDEEDACWGFICSDSNQLSMCAVDMISPYTDDNGECAQDIAERLLM
jgi:hypothetical protein